MTLTCSFTSYSTTKRNIDFLWRAADAFAPMHSRRCHAGACRSRTVERWCVCTIVVPIMSNVPVPKYEMPPNDIDSAVLDLMKIFWDLKNLSCWHKRCSEDPIRAASKIPAQQQPKDTACNAAATPPSLPNIRELLRAIRVPPPCTTTVDQRNHIVLCSAPASGSTLVCGNNVEFGIRMNRNFNRCNSDGHANTLIVSLLNARTMHLIKGGLRPSRRIRTNIYAPSSSPNVDDEHEAARDCLRLKLSKPHCTSLESFRITTAGCSRNNNVKVCVCFDLYCERYDQVGSSTNPTKMRLMHRMLSHPYNLAKDRHDDANDHK